jgi:hypothetical protein
MQCSNGRPVNKGFSDACALKPQICERLRQASRPPGKSALLHNTLILLEQFRTSVQALPAKAKARGKLRAPCSV